MKKHLLTVRVGVALGLGLVLTQARPALAQTILTPIQLLNKAPYFVRSFSVSGGDSTIALDVRSNQDQVEDVWIVSRRGNAGENFSVTNPGIGELAMAPAWNPNGEFLAYIEHVENPQDLDHIIVSGQVTDIITPDSLLVRNFSWSNDDATLALGAVDQTTASENVYTVFIDGLKLQQVTNCVAPARCSNPQWNPFDDVIAYETNQNGRPEIGLTNFTGSLSKIIVSNASTPVWSPGSGQLLAYVCGNDVCVANEDGSNAHNLTSGALGLKFSSPSWSLDETLIAFLGTAGNATAGDIYVVPANGGDLVPWTSASNATAPQWSPLESVIFYGCNNSGSVDLCVLAGPTTIPTNGPCSASTCPGCCLDGQCFPGTSDLACKILGPTCAVCGAGSTCDATAGRCVEMTANCNVFPCSGCCDPSGVCQPGTQSNACGLDGQKCVTCQQPSTCAASGVCKTPPTSCGASNCSGCCDPSHNCHPGTDANACGVRGLACAACAVGASCDASSGACRVTVCSPSNCTGCCAPNGQCQSGTTNAFCGSNGFSCQTCSVGSQCSGLRDCRPVPSCSADTCIGGCCDVTGACRPGNSADACGAGGVTCMPCSSSGFICDQNTRTCTTPAACSPSNCLGCCGPADRQCHSGVQNSACGFSGFNCETCSQFEHCDPEALFCVSGP